MWRWLFPILPLVTCAVAEERTARQWADELKATYGKQKSYIATYHAERNGKTAVDFCALDVASGAMATEIKVIDHGSASGVHWWSAGDDQLFASPLEGNSSFRISGIRRELKWYDHLSGVIGGLTAEGEEPSTVEAKFTFQPTILFVSDMIASGIYSTTSGRPVWHQYASKGRVARVEPDSVTFATAQGDLTVDRKSGMLIKQILPDKEGPPRILELTKLELNPGQKAVEALSSKWDSEHNEPRTSHQITGQFRTATVQLVVESVQSGSSSHEKLEKELVSGRDELRSIADSWIGQGKLVDNAVWKKLFDILKEDAHKDWLAKVPGADKANEAVFEAYLAGPQVREQSRELLVKIVKDSALRPKIVTEILPTPITTKNEAGEGAKALVEEAFVRAYVEAIADRKFPEYWGERDGLH